MITTVAAVIGTPEPRRAPGETWLVAGGVLFGLGLLAILTALVPIVLDHGSVPIPLRLATLLAPLGVLVGLVGPVRARRAARVAPAAPAGRGAGRFAVAAGTSPTRIAVTGPAPDQVDLTDPATVTPA